MTPRQAGPMVDPGRQGLGQQFRPVQGPGAAFAGMPPQAQGSPYGVPFIPLGSPANPATMPPPAAPRALLMSRALREGLVGGGGGMGRDRNGFGRDMGGRGGSQFSGRDRGNFGH